MSATDEFSDRPFETGIRPDFQLHELRVKPGTMNSPQEPAVDIWTEDLGTRRMSAFDQLTPAQAREYARRLLAAADIAEGKR